MRLNQSSNKNSLKNHKKIISIRQLGDFKIALSQGKFIRTTDVSNRRLLSILELRVLWP